MQHAFSSPLETAFGQKRTVCLTSICSSLILLLTYVIRIKIDWTCFRLKMIWPCPGSGLGFWSWTSGISLAKKTATPGRNTWWTTTRVCRPVIHSWQSALTIVISASISEIKTKAKIKNLSSSQMRRPILAIRVYLLWINIYLRDFGKKKVKILTSLTSLTVLNCLWLILI